MEEQTVNEAPQTQHPEKPKMKSHGSVHLGLLLLAITLPILVVFVRQQVEIRSRAVGGGNIPTALVGTNPCTGAKDGTACTDTCARACAPNVSNCIALCTTRYGFCIGGRCETWLTPTSIPTRTPTPTPTPVEGCAPNGSTCTIHCPPIPYCPAGQTCPPVYMPYPCSAQNLTPKGICANNRCVPATTPTPGCIPIPPCYYYAGTSEQPRCILVSSVNYCPPTTPPPPRTPTPTSTLIPGDLTGNGTVDIYDYNIMLENFGKTGSPGWIPADINKDGEVDIYDYNILIGNFGT